MYNMPMNPSFPYLNRPMCWCGLPPMYNYPFAWSTQNMGNDIDFQDQGKKPYVININEAAKLNNNFRTVIWTGEHLQVTLMKIEVGEDIGLEVHPDVDQFLRIEEGQGFVQMGNVRNNLYFQRNVFDDDAIMVPAGTWHNITNTGNIPVRLYTIYAPPEHPFGTVHQTKTEAMAAEGNE